MRVKHACRMYDRTRLCREFLSDASRMPCTYTCVLSFTPPSRTAIFSLVSRQKSPKRTQIAAKDTASEESAKERARKESLLHLRRVEATFKTLEGNEVRGKAGAGHEISREGAHLITHKIGDVLGVERRERKRCLECEIPQHECDVYRFSFRFSMCRWCKRPRPQTVLSDE